jgi:hypothetical protein
MAISVNGTCPLKRRTRGDMQDLRAALVEVLTPTAGLLPGPAEPQHPRQGEHIRSYPKLMIIRS